MVCFLRVAAALALCCTAADDLGFRRHYHAPKQQGTYPVVLFVPGFGGDVVATAYGDMVSHLKEHGFIVVGLDHLQMPNYLKWGQAFHDVMEWVGAGHLQAELDKAGLAAQADLDKVAVMAQSAGNHVVGQGLTDGCSVAKAMVMLDPVDGLDPYGFMHGQDLITPGQKVTFTIPSLLMDNALDPTRKNFLVPACAPTTLGAPRWFDAAAGPVWNVNASSYGHVDCMDDSYIAILDKFCPSDKNTDKAAYRKHVADTAATFLDGVLNGNTGNFKRLEDESQFSVGVSLRRDLKGLSHADIKPGCSNSAIFV